MKNVDYIIVGGGYAGLFFAHQLLKNNKTFILFCKEEKGASQVSAGIINPVVLKRFTTFWKAKEQINFLIETLSEIEKYTHQNYLIDAPIHRVFHDEKEKELWEKKSNNNKDLKYFLNEKYEHLKTIKNPFDCGKINDSYRLNVSNFFKDLFQYLASEEKLIRENFDYSELHSHLYKDIHFKHIVFAEGIHIKQNPYFKDVEITPNKGHHLEVALTEIPPQNITIKKKYFLFPIENNLYYQGGTYDRFQTEEGIDETAKEQLINGLKEIYPFEFSVQNVRYGFRPTVKDRKPIIGQHQNYDNFYIFNGLGARGILNGCFFSKSLFDFIEHQIELPEEVNINRFK